MPNWPRQSPSGKEVWLGEPSWKQALMQQAKRPINSIVIPMSPMNAQRLSSVRSRSNATAQKKGVSSSQ